MLNKFGKLILTGTALGVFAIIYGAAIFFIGESIWKNIYFYLVAIGYIVVVSWIFETKYLSESKKVFFALLIFVLIFALYTFSRNQNHESPGGRSYLQEVCPDCDQP